MITDDASARGWLETCFKPTPRQWDQLERFASALIAANAQQNLVSASTLPTLWARHIADSAQLLCHDTRHEAGLWFDLGSGAGFPGLVVAILSERPVWLIESRALRCAFLNDVTEALGLGRQVVIKPHRLEHIDSIAAATISARAFAPLPRLIDLSARFSTQSTRWLLPRGRNAVKELAMLPRTWQSLFHVEPSVTDTDSGILVGLGKVGGASKTR